MMTFEEYLAGKKIDSVAFRKAEPARWEEWRNLYDSVSEKSFTSQKLYLINPLRRKYLLKAQSTPESSGGPQGGPPPKPIFRPKLK